MQIPTISSIENPALAEKITTHLNDLTKPLGALGRLEELALQYCLIRGSDTASIDTMTLFTFAGDHGIVAEGVAPFPKKVTTQMVLNMAAGGAAVSVMCRTAGIGYHVVDVGVDADFPDHPALIKAKVARGTKSFLNGYAMDAETTAAAIETGIRIASTATGDIFGIGEMGIGNTSPASALYALMLGLDGRETVGAGTGAHRDLLEHKKSVISKAVSFHKTTWNGTAFDALARVGGLEIAAMTGFILESAARRVPVVVDGFISSAAALVALRMEPTVHDYCIFSHASAEAFHKQFLAAEKIVPILDLGLRLGEGTGAVLAMQIVKQAMACYNEMATFSSAGVSGAGA